MSFLWYTRGVFLRIRRRFRSPRKLRRRNLRNADETWTHAYVYVYACVYIRHVYTFVCRHSKYTFYIYYHIYRNYIYYNIYNTHAVLVCPCTSSCGSYSSAASAAANGSFSCKAHTSNYISLAHNVYPLLLQRSTYIIPKSTCLYAACKNIKYICVM
jgi:hypothetical protein